jgi:uncharacterized protein (DUF2235 family)
MAERRRNIVLLSDGTGNSSAKLMKTNVWRMYQGIDLSAGDQVAFYDNGVGTSSFKPLAVLGGGLGWGLKRNVLHLYMAACATFKRDDETGESDALYAFGFSRGAFTIRVLVGLIDSQGLIQNVRGRELERQAKWAYRAYRRESNPTGGLVGPFRKIRDVLLRIWERKPRYTGAGNLKSPKVAFVGLWDTVDAYGLPVDEMTRGWDQWVWPLSICDHHRPAVVDKLCHAIALDDERHTFHPVLLDERADPLEATIAKEKTSQVWFAGVHSNVGGGYPDDSLAHVSLRWMADQAARAEPPLRIHPHVRAEWDTRADPNGPLNDSRRGVGTYYRYNPRSIQKLTDDRFADVKVPRPKIHESVLRRIAAGRDDYAPIVLPQEYAVVTEDGHIVAPDAFEHPTQRESRCADQERVWNIVWWRRVVYFSMVFLTVLLALRILGSLIPWRSNGLSKGITLIGGLLPGLAQPWVEYYAHHPVAFAVGGTLLLLLFMASIRLQRRITDRMHALWAERVALPGAEGPVSKPPTDWVFRLRSHPIYRSLFAFASQRAFPFIFGMASLAAITLVIAGTVNRAAFAIAGVSGAICRAQPAAWDGSSVKRAFPSSALCFDTGLFLETDQRYRVEISLPADWADASNRVESPAGFDSGRKPRVFIPALPFRRVLTAKWFVPMLRVGVNHAEYHALDSSFVEFSPRQKGQLFLFVNDAIGPVDFDWFYQNNHGVATVTIADCRKARCEGQGVGQ